MMANRNSKTGNTEKSAGYNNVTKTYSSLRPKVELPPKTQPLSLPQYVLSLLPSTATTTTFLTNATVDSHLSYSQFLRHVSSLTSALQRVYRFEKNDVALILCGACFEVPVLYFALLSLGVVVSPANPIGSKEEVEHHVALCRPVVAFACDAAAPKVPILKHGTVIIDSPEFLSFLDSDSESFKPVEVSQDDPAAILYSSGTTGRVKGVRLTHRNFIALIAGLYHLKHIGVTGKEQEPEPHPVSLFTLPLFHVFGFFMFVRAMAFGETLVLMERFEFEAMLRAVEKYKVTYMPVSPPLVVALAKLEIVREYDLGSLRMLGCGGAPLGKEVIDQFGKRFPSIDIVQGYGLTESGGGGTRMIGPDEPKQHRSVGRLAENMEAKIVDPVNGAALPPGNTGELWLRGPTIMKGYVGDDKATAETLDPEGWLKTGDLCYFDSEGFLYIVDRLKELIKYKAYQVPPAELEHILQSNTEIVDAAVIPYPDEEAGQIPMAFVVRKPGSNISEAQIINFVAKQVAPYKKVRRVAFINSIPKSPAGKILRRELIKQALSGGSAKL